MPLCGTRKQFTTTAKQGYQDCGNLSIWSYRSGKKKKIAFQMSVKWEGIIEKYQSEKQKGSEGWDHSLTHWALLFLLSFLPLPLSAGLTDQPLLLSSPSKPACSLCKFKCISKTVSLVLLLCQTWRATWDSKGWDCMVRICSPTRVRSHPRAQDLQKAWPSRSCKITHVHRAPQQ